ncbi:MAG: GNAT family N-acetyltransferase [Tabrizicola sp.]|jgi:ribosomal protein S18 acetylase RimI-like enzyme|nr:GNAT family N-acetyltransferase [Tabrizicola sp.]
MVKIVQATTPEQLDAVRNLMRAFSDWHYVRHAAYRDLIDQYFDGTTFENELRGLPGKFGPPRGCLLVASVGADYAGCVGLRDIGEGVCEMKRLFVLPQYQGCGVGKVLAKAILDEAKGLGFHMMRLDTGPNSTEAQDIYRKLGFLEIQPYYAVDDRMRDWLTFMERPL